jgi:anti-sigma factor RsiW
MKCVEREKIFVFTHRMLEPREESEVRAHLAECSECRAVAEEFRKLDAVLDEWKPTEPSPWFDTRVRAALAAEERKRAARPLFGLRWAQWLVPAVVVALVVLGVVLLRRSPQVPQPVAHESPPPVTRPAPTMPPQTQPKQLAKAQPPAVTQPQTAARAEEDELNLYENLPILEDYDLLANFDVLSELPAKGKKIVN